MNNQSHHAAPHRVILLTFACIPLLLLFPSPTPAASEIDDSDSTLRVQAEILEMQGDWGGAAAKYAELLRQDRNQSFVHERYRYCIRRHYQIVRLRDTSYQREVLTLKYPQAVRLYEIVLSNLLNNSLDKNKVSAGLLFRHGLEEYRFGLGSHEFCFSHLAGLSADHTRALRSTLQAHYGGTKSMTLEEAVESMREVAMKSKNHFPELNPTIVVMEFLCGACLAVDDYTAYLTPRQLRELCATLKGEQISVGLRLKMRDGKLVVADVLPDSPAALISPPLSRDDHVVGIEKKSTVGMSAEAAMEMLDGEEGTTVELVIASPGQSVRLVALRRRAISLSSVQHDLIGNIGHLKIHCFQESTLQEFDAKLAELMKSGCKALVLDLRGNPGGLLDVSVDIAKRFLPSGIIVSTQHQDPKSSKVYRSDNSAALTMPVVVLVNGDTASAAEVLAGALKENNRAKIVGQTTFGKGCSQGLLKLPGEGELRLPTATSAAGSAGGIRITIARFFSPSGRPYSGRGVEPDVPIEGELQLYQAREVAQRLLASRKSNEQSDDPDPIPFSIEPQPPALFWTVPKAQTHGAIPVGLS